MLLFLLLPHALVLAPASFFQLPDCLTLFLVFLFLLLCHVPAPDWTVRLCFLVFQLPDQTRYHRRWHIVFSSAWLFVFVFVFSTARLTRQTEI